MDFIAHDTSLNRNPSTRAFFEFLQQEATKAQRIGRCFYRYPLWDQSNQYIPDIVVLDAQFGLLAIDVRDVTIDSISSVGNDHWVIDEKSVECPALRLDDFIEEMQGQFNSSRPLRRLTKSSYRVALPLISKAQFESKFPGQADPYLIFDDYQASSYGDLWSDKSDLKGELSALFIAVAQGDSSMNADYSSANAKTKADSMGPAIALINSRIRSLDITQLKPEIQVPDGPQRIRGLAGTGKTIILAKRAALLHNLQPDAKILYTFHTQSLYNLIKRQIEEAFPRGLSVHGKMKSIDWEKLLVRHSFGGRTTREGVYYRTCLRNSVTAQSFFGNLDAACKDLLQHPITPEFDYVLIDEAQDLPASFFQLIWAITKPVDPSDPKSPKRIIFAYDELQSLADSLDIKDTTELFGTHSDGTPRVDFSKGSYGDGIEMDYTLRKTYRNPFELLMIAHGLGLGLYNKTGEMQMTDKRETWEAIGYSVEGTLSSGEKVKLTRDPSDSRSLVTETYSGKQPVIRVEKCQNRDEEMQRISNSIMNDISSEGVKPEDIVVISLETSRIDEKFRPLQHQLWKLGIQSIIPGVGEIDRDRFAESGKVTLSTVFKVKGNEAHIVYIMYFDYLYRHLDFVNVRNRAFTSISRTKGWCRIYGIGPEMDRAMQEIDDIRKNIPTFTFVFPPPEKIKRSLSREELAQTRLRKREVKEALVALDRDKHLVSESEASATLQAIKGKLTKKELQMLIEEIEAEEAEGGG